ncbi:hypothetical protein X738_28130 [Mesorhizobium sp. LNHC209A00]|nr:hypothetical protein X738_28130 [Mesorhizobium sp. LNHC209A00]
MIGNVEDVIVTGEEVDTTIETRAGKYLDHLLECPYCGIIRLQIPKDV